MFSVIIPTRDRPALFAEALASVLAQQGAEFEIVVVNDGSGPENIEAYRLVEGQADPRVKFIHLLRRPRGHGQSYALNVGADAARNPYLAFLDDDDTWTDPQYLARVANTLGQSERPIDMHLANQSAYDHKGQRKPHAIWIGDLESILKSDGLAAAPDGTYAVTITQLLRCTGFCHLNTMIVRRELYRDLGGMDEGIRWECDREIYFRLIDRAEVIKFAPPFVSRHNIPDPMKQASMTTSISMLEKRLQQLRVLDKISLYPNHAEIRQYARRHKGYALKKIVEELTGMGRYSDALWYSWQALAALPTARWTVYSFWLSLCRVMRGATPKINQPD